MAKTSCLMAKSRWNLHLITWSILVRLVEFIIYLTLLKKWENTSYICEVFSSHCLIFKLCNYNWYIPKSRMVFPFNPTQQSKSRIIFKHHENTMTMWCFNHNDNILRISTSWWYIKKKIKLHSLFFLGWRSQKSMVIAKYLLQANNKDVFKSTQEYCN